MTDIRLTGVPEELAAKIEAAWNRSVEEIRQDDSERFWTEHIERQEALSAAYDELFRLPVPGLLSCLLIDARAGTRAEIRRCKRELEIVRGRLAAEAVSP